MTSRPRTATGHVLLPAFDASQEVLAVPVVSRASLVSWTFGRGTVIWRIWPAVLLHTLFAALIVTISLRTNVHLGIPNVLLTLLGVVIGFVISYRASSGYDRYWQGRSAWGDLARTTRTFSRLVWINIPLKLSSTPSSSPTQTEVDVEVAQRIMSEKRMALGLIEGYVVAVKHHLRGEMGIYYEDLYPLVKPLHEHEHHHHNTNGNVPPTVEVTEVISPRDFHPEEPVIFPLPLAIPPHPPASQPPTQPTDPNADPVIPPINAYGTFIPHPPLHHARSSTSLSSETSDPGERHALLPGAARASEGRQGLFGGVAGDLIPFHREWTAVRRMVGLPGRSDSRDEEAGMDGVAWVGRARREQEGSGARAGTKHRPRVAGGGENLPLEILRSLSVWLSVLDERGVVPGPALGGMYGCIAAFEDSLSTLERILTTPLPFVYAVHIRTVWIYLFALPFQLVDNFGWYTIPGVCMAAFIYLGLIAAGEEIEQPFGYDENDIDLDFFCRAIISADIARLQRVACPNVYLGAHHAGMHVVRKAHDVAVDLETRVDAVFGGGHRI